MLDMNVGGSNVRKVNIIAESCSELYGWYYCAIYFCINQEWIKSGSRMDQEWEKENTYINIILRKMNNK